MQTLSYGMLCTADSTLPCCAMPTTAEPCPQQASGNHKSPVDPNEVQMECCEASAWQCIHSHKSAKHGHCMSFFVPSSVVAAAPNSTALPYTMSTVSRTVQTGQVKIKKHFQLFSLLTGAAAAASSSGLLVAAGPSRLGYLSRGQ